MHGMQNMKTALLIVIGSSLLGFQAKAIVTPESKEKESTPQVKEIVKYRAGAAMNFDEMLIQGQLKRPELNVVVGNAAESSDGLLRLRENFNDQTQIDIGEELQ